ncbi:MAG TPA: hypothetical protein VFY48_10470 [Solirubrobacterales bacterium]|nr:hypothetical protein [Solirubrobacterales bacterium]
MGTVRIRWKGLGKVAAAAVAGLLALQALPGLLRAPQPPPLAPDVGLPRVQVQRPEPVAAPKPPPRKPRRSQPPKPRPIRRAEPLGRNTTQKRGSTDRGEVEAAPVPLAVPAQAPAPVAPPPPVPPPIPPPAPPGDGSVEFMPH